MNTSTASPGAMVLPEPKPTSQRYFHDLDLNDKLEECEAKGWNACLHVIAKLNPPGEAGQAIDAAALQVRLVASEARTAELERVLGGMLFAFDDGVGRDWSAPLLDHARKQCKAVEYVAQPARSGYVVESHMDDPKPMDAYPYRAPVEREQGIPGTSFQALNAKACAGDL